jgi:hypothetical protein
MLFEHSPTLTPFDLEHRPETDDSATHSSIALKVATPRTLDYVPERGTTPAAWALAATPFVTAMSQAAAVVLSDAGDSVALWALGASVFPILWIVVWVRRDRMFLHDWGHLRRAHWAWAFLGDVGYLTARTIVVRQQTNGRGWWPLLSNLLATAVLVNIGLFTPVFEVLRGVLM